MFDVKVYNKSQIKKVRAYYTESMDYLTKKSTHSIEGNNSLEFKKLKAELQNYGSSCIHFIDQCTVEGRTVDDLAISYIQRKFEYIKKNIKEVYKNKDMSRNSYFSMPLHLTQSIGHIMHMFKGMKMA